MDSLDVFQQYPVADRKRSNHLWLDYSISSWQSCLQEQNVLVSALVSPGGS